MRRSIRPSWRFEQRGPAIRAKMGMLSGRRGDWGRRISAKLQICRRVTCLLANSRVVGLFSRPKTCSTRLFSMGWRSVPVRGKCSSTSSTKSNSVGTSSGSDLLRQREKRDSFREFLAGKRRKAGVQELQEFRSCRMRRRGLSRGFGCLGYGATAQISTARF
jgi:hypothetical protein